MGRKRRKSAGKRRGSSFPRDLWGRTASARDTTYSPDQVRTGALQAVFSSGNRVPRAVVACPSGTVTSRRGHETHRHNYTRPPASLGDELLAICSIAQLTSCELCMYRHHVCSRWQRGIEIYVRQSSWSAAPAERVNVARRWSTGSCGAGRASKLGLSWHGPSSMYCPASLMCAGRTHTATDGQGHLGCVSALPMLARGSRLWQI